MSSREPVPSMKDIQRTLAKGGYPGKVDAPPGTPIIDQNLLVPVDINQNPRALEWWE